MFLSDVKRCTLRNLHILKTQESLRDNNSTFDEDWKVFIDTFRRDPTTQSSWYLI